MRQIFFQALILHQETVSLRSSCFFLY
jgi:hypothetical protein